MLDRLIARGTVKTRIHDDHERSNTCAVANLDLLKRRDGCAAADRDVVSNTKEGTRSCHQMGSHGA